MCLATKELLNPNCFLQSEGKALWPLNRASSVPVTWTGARYSPQGQGTWFGLCFRGQKTNMTTGLQRAGNKLHLCLGWCGLVPRQRGTQDTRSSLPLKKQLGQLQQHRIITEIFLRLSHIIFRGWGNKNYTKNKQTNIFFCLVLWVCTHAVYSGMIHIQDVRKI